MRAIHSAEQLAKGGAEGEEGQVRERADKTNESDNDYKSLVAWSCRALNRKGLQMEDRICPGRSEAEEHSESSKGRHGGRDRSHVYTAETVELVAAAHGQGWHTTGGNYNRCIK
jgi:hypothetical protein